MIGSGLEASTSVALDPWRHAVAVFLPGGLIYEISLRGCSVAPPYSIWRLHIVTEMELKSEYEVGVR